MTHSLSRVACVGLVLAFVSPLYGQSVIQVSGGGTALEDAARGAPAGSTFIIQPGRYNAFPWSVPDATIIAPQRATLVGYMGVNQSAGSLRMANIDVVGGFRSTPYGTYPNPGRISTFVDIVLDGVNAEGLSGRNCSLAVSNGRFGNDRTAVEMWGCDAVLTDVTVFGGIFFSYYGPFSYAEDGMQIADSTVRMERVSISATSYGGAGASGRLRTRPAR